MLVGSQQVYNLIYTLWSIHVHNFLPISFKVKTNCCLFERLFKVKKNDVFLFGISFFVTEIFTFLCYANKESDDVIGGSSNSTTLNHEYLWKYQKQCSSNLAPETNITKERK